MKPIKSIQNLIDSFEKLPGIGPKTAQRLTFYLLHVPQSDLDEFGQAVQNLKKKTKTCSLCFNIAESDPCPICTDPAREKSTICIVEQPLDVLVLEKMGVYKGLYHVLHGAINPLENIGPEELHIYDLLPRLKNGKIQEIIIATNPTMEGEATAMYINQLIRKNRKDQIDQNIKISRIGRGLPTGADLEYADQTTLSKAFEGRRDF